MLNPDEPASEDHTFAWRAMSDPASGWKPDTRRADRPHFGGVWYP